MADKRIIELDNVASVTDDDYVMIDNATNGTGKVKATLFSGGINYSTTEQDTGLKWIDGKPIYQKTIMFDSSVTITGDGYTPTVISSTYTSGLNIENIIACRCYRNAISNVSTACMDAFALFDGQNIKIYAGVGLNNASSIVIQYTKTTDTV